MNIGSELDKATAALDIKAATWPPSAPAILDLCMAPGGFSRAALNRNPNASLRGISLPVSQGGHEMLIHNWESDWRIKIEFRDITMLAIEMGLPSLSAIPPNHPDLPSFSAARPFHGMHFDLVLCDGQVLRTHPRQAYRAKCEATRLLTSQLVLALQRIRPGGTLVLLLHRLDSWPSVALLHTFAAFANVTLFKPRQRHAMRTSFYLVAKNVRPEGVAAREAVAVWQEQWKAATFSFEEEGRPWLELLEAASEATVKAVLDEVGPMLIEMGEEVFAIQAGALRNASFMKNAGGESGVDSGAGLN